MPRAGRDLAYVVAALGAALLALFLVRTGFSEGVIGFDFEGTLWEPGRAILDGRNPYPEPVVSELEVGNPAVYPPLLMVVVAPFTVLPWHVGVALWIGLLAGAVIGSLYVLGVRDLRCYVLALISAPVVSGLLFGNATLLLLPLVALAWVWRERWVRCGVVVALAIASKLFLWPLLVWLVASRRYGAAGTAVTVLFLAVSVPWALIGFSGLTSYVDLLRATEQIYAVHSFSIATMLSALGADSWWATRTALTVGLLIAALALVVGRRGLDAASLSLAVLAAVLGSPILWQNYYALLLVPVAIARPRFSGIWVAFTLFSVAAFLPRPRLDASAFLPGGPACCRPHDVPYAVWAFNHAPPGLWPALWQATLAVAIAAFVVVSLRRQQVSNEAAHSPS